MPHYLASVYCAAVEKITVVVLFVFLSRYVSGWKESEMGVAEDKLEMKLVSWVFQECYPWLLFFY